MDRRTFLRNAALLSGVVAARPWAALGDALGPALPGTGVSRTSKLAASNGLSLLTTDLHNHSLISGDAFGDPGDAYRQMRSKGIDVAVLTEHAISGKHHGEITCPGHEQGGCHTVEGINETDWQTMKYLADIANDPGSFVTFRSFEYSTPTVGHLNVYFSQQYTDAMHEHAFFTPPAAAEIDRVIPGTDPVVDNFAALPDIAQMRFFWEWLSSPPEREVFGGGNDGIACFNHPGEFGDFEGFSYHESAGPLVVLCEALNTDRDFFWYGVDRGLPNPLNACLNAGWRVGFTGVSDEHSTTYGKDGLARGGLWATGLTREAVREAMISRHSFATFEHGLRLDATANDVSMGSALKPGTAQIALDLDAGPAWVGKELVVEVITPGENAATLAASHIVTVPALESGPIELEADVSDSRWMFLRITDPERAPDANATGAHAEHGKAIAYASPWFFDGV
jgi:hypothetical protein